MVYQQIIVWTQRSKAVLKKDLTCMYPHIRTQPMLSLRSNAFLHHTENRFRSTENTEYTENNGDEDNGAPPLFLPPHSPPSISHCACRLEQNECFRSGYVGVTCSLRSAGAEETLPPLHPIPVVAVAPRAAALRLSDYPLR